MNWMRLSTDYFRHRKTLRLVRRLGEVAALYPLKLWLWAVEQSESGNLRDLEPEELATLVGFAGKPSDLWKTMADCGFIERDAEEGWRIRSWEEHQLPLIESREKARARWRVWRDRKLAGESAPTANAVQTLGKPLANALTNERTKRTDETDERTERASARSEFDAFWEFYPRKVGKPDAQKAWRQVQKERPRLHALYAAIAAQVAAASARDGDWLGFFRYPATWLRARGWNDAPQALAPKKRNGELGWSPEADTSKPELYGFAFEAKFLGATSDEVAAIQAAGSRDSAAELFAKIERRIISETAPGTH